MVDNPVIFIQCDWDDVLRQSHGSIWVSLKKRGESKQIHGKIEKAGYGSSNDSQFIGTGGFSAQFISNDIIRVEHKEYSAMIHLVAPTKIFTDIHNKSIPCLDVTTTGLCVSFCSERGLIISDFNRGELKLKLGGHIGDVYRCKFFPSQKVVLSGGADLQLKIWCAETGRCPVSLKGHKRAITDFVIVDVGRNVISVSKDGSAKLWDCGESSCLDTLINTSSDINCCAISVVPHAFSIGEPDVTPSEREIGTQNKILLIGCEDGSSHCVAVYSRKKLFSLVLKSAINSVAFLDTNSETENENIFVIGCQSGEVSVRGIKNPKEPIKIIWILGSPVLNILPYKKTGFLVSHADGSVYFVKNYTYEVLFSFTGPDCDPVYCLASEGRFLYTCCRDGTIRRYSIEKAISLLLK